MFDFECSLRMTLPPLSAWWSLSCTSVIAAPSEVKVTLMASFSSVVNFSGTGAGTGAPAGVVAPGAAAAGVVAVIVAALGAFVAAVRAADAAAAGLGGGAGKYFW